LASLKNKNTKQTFNKLNFYYTAQLDYHFENVSDAGNYMFQVTAKWKLFAQNRNLSNKNQNEGNSTGVTLPLVMHRC